MEWSRIKNIVIIILLLLNAFLLFIVVSREVQDTYSRENARRSAITILRDNGVILEEETVPHTMNLGPMQISRDLELEREGKRQLAWLNMLDGRECDLEYARMSMIDRIIILQKRLAAHGGKK